MTATENNAMGSTRPSLDMRQATFVGSDEWRQDSDGILFSPIWNQCITQRGTDLLKREDFLYPAADVYAELDLQIEFRTFGPFWSVGSLGMVFRAQDSVRFYCLEIIELEPAATESKFQARFYVQDASGYRRDIGAATADHPPLPRTAAPVLGRSQTYLDASPIWTTVRVRAHGTTFHVDIGGRTVLEVQDDTYAAGCAGIVSRGPNIFRNLKITGSPGMLRRPWQVVADERPTYFHPWPDPQGDYGDSQTRPGVVRTADGDLIVWFGVNGPPTSPHDVLLVRSSDEGRTWQDPILINQMADGVKAGFFHGHSDGRVSCLYSHDEWKTRERAFSHDKGRSWTEPEPLLLSGVPIDRSVPHGAIGACAPIRRLSDGTLLQCCFHLEGDEAEEREGVWTRHRSLVIRSTDDGLTWTGPHYFDAANYESNDCMLVERRDGSVISFARPFHSHLEWKSISLDRGSTWSPQTPSSCPRVDHHYMIRHSSGVYLMASRGFGVFINTSIDDGETWSAGTRISPCSGNTVLIELRDRRVLAVFHEAYRASTRVRAQFLNVQPDGRIMADSSQ